MYNKDKEMKERSKKDNINRLAREKETRVHEPLHRPEEN
jgi:hypothetical protein